MEHSKPPFGDSPQSGRDAKPLSQDELETILNAHQAYLQNTRRGKRALLREMDLTRLNLSNRILAQADLTGSNLSHSCLKFINLASAVMYCCELAGIDGRYANFNGADMRGVVLSGSNLSHARLDKVDFRAGAMTKTGGNGTSAVIDRSGAAQGVDFTCCSLNGANFDGADLKGADFSGAVIVGTSFKGARMTGVKFRGAILTAVDLSMTGLPPEAFEGAILPPGEAALAQRSAILFQLKSHHGWVESDGRRGMPAVLDGFDLRPVAADIGKFRLTALSAKNVIAAGLDFSCTELQGANFEGADLRGASFEGADLRGTRFSGSLLRHAKFLGADMRPLELKTGGVLACDLNGTDFSLEQRAEAVFA